MTTEKKRRKPKGVITPEAVEKIRLRYESEGSGQLATELNLGTGTVRRIANDMGLTTSAGHKRRAVLRTLLNNSCNINYFKTWTPNMSYTLGFAFADGSVNKKMNRLSFEVHQQDVDILEGIKQDMQSKHKLSLRPPRQKSALASGPSAVLTISSTIVATDLVTLRGLHPQKTYRNDPLPDIPTEMIPHFLRGFFDGDGIVSFHQGRRGTVGFCGTPLFLTGILQHVCNLMGLNDTPLVTDKRNPGLHYLMWQNDSAVLAFRHYLYPEGEHLFGKRKKAKLDLLLQQITDRRLSNPSKRYQTLPSLPPLPPSDHLLLGKHKLS